MTKSDLALSSHRDSRSICSGHSPADLVSSFVRPDATSGEVDRGGKHIIFIGMQEPTSYFLLGTAASHFKPLQFQQILSSTHLLTHRYQVKSPKKRSNWWGPAKRGQRDPGSFLLKATSGHRKKRLKAETLHRGVWRWPVTKNIIKEPWTIDSARRRSHGCRENSDQSPNPDVQELCLPNLWVKTPTVPRWHLKSLLKTQLTRVVVFKPHKNSYLRFSHVLTQPHQAENN